MALYKNPQYITPSPSPEFDKTYTPGQVVPHSGIYRCQSCGDEDSLNAGTTFPTQNHQQHAPSKGPIRWQMVVYAVQQR